MSEARIHVPPSPPAKRVADKMMEALAHARQMNALPHMFILSMADMAEIRSLARGWGIWGTKDVTAERFNGVLIEVSPFTMHSLLVYSGGDAMPVVQKEI